MNEARIWVILVTLTLALVAIILITNFGELRYDCEYDDQVMGSDGTCYDLDSLLDAAND